MIATEHFVYIHLHKSAGTFVNQCLLRFFPDSRQLGYHLPVRLIPKALRGLPILGFVRNPWSYYVSWYSFQSQKPVQNALFRCMSEGGRLDFKQTVRNLLNLGQADGKLDELLPLLPEAYTNRGINLPRQALEPVRGSGQGFYSYLYRYMFTGHAGAMHIGRVENLRDELLGFFGRFGVPIGDELRAYVASEDALNRSAHGHYADYYDDELRDLIASRDSAVVRSFDYVFGA